MATSSKIPFVKTGSTRQMVKDHADLFMLATERRDGLPGWQKSSVSELRIIPESLAELLLNNQHE